MSIYVEWMYIMDDFNNIEEFFDYVVNRSKLVNHKIKTTKIVNPILNEASIHRQVYYLSSDTKQTRVRICGKYTIFTDKPVNCIIVITDNQINDFNIFRNFKYGEKSIAYVLFDDEDVFDLSIAKLMIQHAKMIHIVGMV